MTVRAFNPGAWLRDFERTGGAFAHSGDRLCLFIVPGDRPGHELSTARELIAALTPDERVAIRTHLSEAVLSAATMPSGRSAPTSVVEQRWAALIADYRVSQAGWSASDENAQSSAMAALNKSLGALVEHRAPSIHHLAEKLAIIIADYEGEKVPEEYLAEVLADVRHLCVEA